MSASTISLSMPTDRLYDGAHHVWAFRDSTTGRVKIGIDALGLDALGELAYISLQAEGIPVRRGDAIGMLEAAKMTSELVAPISGVITARNEAVLRQPGLVNQDPYAAGWLLEIEPSAWEEEAPLLLAGEAILDWVADELKRQQTEEFTF